MTRSSLDKHIPVCTPSIGERELECVTECVKSGWISSKGPWVEEFERKFASYCGVKYGIATTNGTAALHLALSSLGIGKGDEVIIPSFTMMSTAFAVVYCGAKPVLVDAEPDTWNMRVDEIESKITERTRAILPVHIYGHPCDMGPITDIAADRGLEIVEDAAEAHGALYNERKVGGLGTCGCFSFYANKIITTGEGGMVVTDNPDVAERAQLLKDLAFQRDRRFVHSHIGFNYRMTNIQAALGLAQLERIDDLIHKRRWHARLYSMLLKNTPGLRMPVEKPWAMNVYWMYGVVYDGDRDELMMSLAKRGIETRSFFTPVHEQPVFNGKYKEERYPVAEHLGKHGFYLPSSSGLSNEEIEDICGVVYDEIERQKK